MDFFADPAGRYVRIIAIVSLLLGLNDTAYLLGVSLGDVSPITTMGVGGFSWLGVFTLARLFASVGLWIKASWGAVLLVGVTAVELTLFLMGNPDVRISAIGFGIRLAVLIALLLIVTLALLRQRRARAQD